MSQDVLVGLDVGTTGVKAVAIAHDGRVLASASEEYELSTPQPGWAEQDPEDWWRAAQACSQRLPEGPVGLSGQMHGLVVLDAEDRVLRPAILWNDQRTEAECAEIEARVGLERLIELTGNRALTGFTAPKLLWLRRHEPETYARIRHVLLPKDYVRLRLTGEHAIDVADASGTLLFDVAGRRWSEEVCAALDVPLEWLPPVHESTEIAGAGDQAAAALGVGIVEPGPCVGRARHVGRRLRGASRVRTRRGGARPCLLPRGAWHLACDGRDAERGGLVRLAPPGARRGVRRARRGGGALGARSRRAPVRAVPRRRAHAACRPRRARRVHGPLASSRPRRACARDARGRRVRAARLARAAARARRPPGGRACLGRRSRERPLAAHRRVGARAAARADGVGGRMRPSEPRFSPASAPACSATPPMQSLAGCAFATGSSRTRSGRLSYEHGYERYRLLYPSLRPLEEPRCLAPRRSDPAVCRCAARLRARCHARVSSAA